jgi:hypothetical protein
MSMCAGHLTLSCIKQGKVWALGNAACLHLSSEHMHVFIQHTGVQAYPSPSPTLTLTLTLGTLVLFIHPKSQVAKPRNIQNKHTKHIINIHIYTYKHTPRGASTGTHTMYKQASSRCAVVHSDDASLNFDWHIKTIT